MPSDLKFVDIFKENRTSYRKNKYGLQREIRLISERIIVEYAPNDSLAIREVVHPLDPYRVPTPYFTYFLTVRSDEYVTSIDFHDHAPYFPYAKNTGDIRLVRYINNFNDRNFTKMSSQNLMKMTGKTIDKLRHGRMDKGVLAVNFKTGSSDQESTTSIFDLVQPTRNIVNYYSKQKLNDFCWTWGNEFVLAFADDEAVRISDMRSPKSYSALFMAGGAEKIAVNPMRIGELTCLADGKIMIFDIRRLDFPCKQYDLNLEYDPVVDLRYNMYLPKQLMVHTESRKVIVYSIEESELFSDKITARAVMEDPERLTFKHVDRGLYTHVNRMTRKEKLPDSNMEIPFVGYEEHYNLSKVDEAVEVPAIWTNPLNWNKTTIGQTNKLDQFQKEDFKLTTLDRLVADTSYPITIPEILYTASNVDSFDFTLPGVNGFFILRSDALQYQAVISPLHFQGSQSIDTSFDSVIDMRKLQCREMVPAHLFLTMASRLDLGWEGMEAFEPNLLELSRTVAGEDIDFWCHWLKNCSFIQYSDTEFARIVAKEHKWKQIRNVPELNVFGHIHPMFEVGNADVLGMCSGFFRVFVPRPVPDVLSESDSEDDEPPEEVKPVLTEEEMKKAAEEKAKKEEELEKKQRSIKAEVLKMSEESQKLFEKFNRKKEVIIKPKEKKKMFLERMREINGKLPDFIEAIESRKKKLAGTAEKKIKRTNYQKRLRKRIKQKSYRYIIFGNNCMVGVGERFSSLLKREQTKRKIAEKIRRRKKRYRRSYPEPAKDAILEPIAKFFPSEPEVVEEVSEDPKPKPKPKPKPPPPPMMRGRGMPGGPPPGPPTKEPVKLLFATGPRRITKYKPRRFREMKLIEFLRKTMLDMDPEKREEVFGSQFSRKRSANGSINHRNLTDLKVAFQRAQRSGWPMFYDNFYFFSERCSYNQLLASVAMMFKSLEVKCLPPPPKVLSTDPPKFVPTIQKHMVTASPLAAQKPRAIEADYSSKIHPSMNSNQTVRFNTIPTSSSYQENHLLESDSSGIRPLVSATDKTAAGESTSSPMKRKRNTIRVMGSRIPKIRRRRNVKIILKTRGRSDGASSRKIWKKNLNSSVINFKSIERGRRTYENHPVFGSTYFRNLRSKFQRYLFSKSVSARSYNKSTESIAEKDEENQAIAKLGEAENFSSNTIGDSISELEYVPDSEVADNDSDGRVSPNSDLGLTIVFSAFPEINLLEVHDNDEKPVEPNPEIVIRYDDDDFIETDDLPEEISEEITDSEPAPQITLSLDAEEKEPEEEPVKNLSDVEPDQPEPFDVTRVISDSVMYHNRRLARYLDQDDIELNTSEAVRRNNIMATPDDPYINEVKAHYEHIIEELKNSSVQLEFHQNPTALKLMKADVQSKRSKKATREPSNDNKNEEEKSDSSVQKSKKSQKVTFLPNFPIWKSPVIEQIDPETGKWTVIKVVPDPEPRRPRIFLSHADELLYERVMTTDTIAYCTDPHEVPEKFITEMKYSKIPFRNFYRITVEGEMNYIVNIQAMQHNSQEIFCAELDQLQEIDTDALKIVANYEDKISDDVTLPLTENGFMSLQNGPLVNIDLMYTDGSNGLTILFAGHYTEATEERLKKLCSLIRLYETIAPRILFDHTNKRFYGLRDSKYKLRPKKKKPRVVQILPWERQRNNLMSPRRQRKKAARLAAANAAIKAALEGSWEGKSNCKNCIDEKWPSKEICLNCEPEPVFNSCSVISQSYVTCTRCGKAVHKIRCWFYGKPPAPDPPPPKIQKQKPKIVRWKPIPTTLKSALKKKKSKKTPKTPKEKKKLKKKKKRKVKPIKLVKLSEKMKNARLRKRYGLPKAESLPAYTKRLFNRYRKCDTTEVIKLDDLVEHAPDENFAKSQSMLLSFMLRREFKSIAKKARDYEHEEILLTEDFKTAMVRDATDLIEEIKAAANANAASQKASENEQELVTITNKKTGETKKVWMKVRTEEEKKQMALDRAERQKRKEEKAAARALLGENKDGEEGPSEKTDPAGKSDDKSEPAASSSQAAAQVLPPGPSTSASTPAKVEPVKKSVPFRMSELLRRVGFGRSAAKTEPVAVRTEPAVQTQPAAPNQDKMQPSSSTKPKEQKAGENQPTSSSSSALQVNKPVVKPKVETPILKPAEKTPGKKSAESQPASSSSKFAQFFSSKPKTPQPSRNTPQPIESSPQPTKDAPQSMKPVEKPAGQTIAAEQMASSSRRLPLPKLKPNIGINSPQPSKDAPQSMKPVEKPAGQTIAAEQMASSSRRLPLPKLKPNIGINSPQPSKDAPQSMKPVEKPAGQTIAAEQMASSSRRLPLPKLKPNIGINSPQPTKDAPQSMKPVEKPAGQTIAAEQMASSSRRLPLPKLKPNIGINSPQPTKDAPQSLKPVELPAGQTSAAEQMPSSSRRLPLPKLKPNIGINSPRPADRLTLPKLVQTQSKASTSQGAEPVIKKVAAQSLKPEGKATEQSVADYQPTPPLSSKATKPVVKPQVVAKTAKSGEKMPTESREACSSFSKPTEIVVKKKTVAKSVKPAEEKPGEQNAQENQAAVPSKKRMKRVLKKKTAVKSSKPEETSTEQTNAENQPSTSSTKKAKKRVKKKKIIKAPKTAEATTGLETSETQPASSSTKPTKRVFKKKVVVKTVKPGEVSTEKAVTDKLPASALSTIRVVKKLVKRKVTSTPRKRRKRAIKPLRVQILIDQYRKKKLRAKKQKGIVSQTKGTRKNGHVKKRLKKRLKKQIKKRIKKSVKPAENEPTENPEEPKTRTLQKTPLMRFRRKVYRERKEKGKCGFCNKTAKHSGKSLDKLTMLEKWKQKVKMMRNGGNLKGKKDEFFSVRTSWEKPLMCKIKYVDSGDVRVIVNGVNPRYKIYAWRRNQRRSEILKSLGFKIKKSKKIRKSEKKKRYAVYQKNLQPLKNFIGKLSGKPVILDDSPLPAKKKVLVKPKPIRSSLKPRGEWHPAFDLSHPLYRRLRSKPSNLSKQLRQIKLRMIAERTNKKKGWKTVRRRRDYAYYQILKLPQRKIFMERPKFNWNATVRLPEFDPIWRKKRIFKKKPKTPPPSLQRYPIVTQHWPVEEKGVTIGFTGRVRGSTPDVPRSSHLTVPQSNVPERVGPVESTMMSMTRKLKPFIRPFSALFSRKSSVQSGNVAATITVTEAEIAHETATASVLVNDESIPPTPSRRPLSSSPTKKQVKANRPPIKSMSQGSSAEDIGALMTLQGLYPADNNIRNDDSPMFKSKTFATPLKTVVNRAKFIQHRKQSVPKRYSRRHRKKEENKKFPFRKRSMLSNRHGNGLLTKRSKWGFLVSQRWHKRQKILQKFKDKKRRKRMRLRKLRKRSKPMWQLTRRRLLENELKKTRIRLRGKPVKRYRKDTAFITAKRRSYLQRLSKRVKPILVSYRFKTTQKHLNLRRRTVTLKLMARRKGDRNFAARKAKKTLFKHYHDLAKQSASSALKKKRRRLPPIAVYGVSKVLKYRVHAFMKHRRRKLFDFMKRINKSGIIWKYDNVFEVKHRVGSKSKIIKLKRKKDIKRPLLARNYLKKDLKSGFSSTKRNWYELYQRIINQAFSHSQKRLTAWSLNEFFRIKNTSKNTMLPADLFETANVRRDSDLESTPPPSGYNTDSDYEQPFRGATVEQEEDHIFFKTTSEQSTYNVKGLPGLLHLAHLVSERVGEHHVRNGKLKGRIFDFYKGAIQVSPIRDMMLMSVGLRTYEGFPHAIWTMQIQDNVAKWFSQLYLCFMYGHGDYGEQLLERIHRVVGKPLKPYKSMDLANQVAAATKLFRKIIGIQNGSEDVLFGAVVKEHLSTEYDVYGPVDDEVSPTGGKFRLEPTWTGKQWMEACEMFIQHAMVSPELRPEILACVHFFRMIFTKGFSDDIIEYIVGLNIKITEKLAFIINWSPHDYIMRAMMVLFHSTRGLDRIAFVGLGYHPDVFRILHEEAVLTGDSQLITHLLIVGQCLDPISRRELIPFVGSNHIKHRDVASLLEHGLRNTGKMAKGAPILQDVFPYTYLRDKHGNSYEGATNEMIVHLQCEVSKYMSVLKVIHGSSYLNRTLNNSDRFIRPITRFPTEITCSHCHTPVLKGVTLGNFGRDLTFAALPITDQVKQATHQLISKNCSYKDHESELVPYVAVTTTPEQKEEQEMQYSPADHACQRCRRPLPRCVVCRCRYLVRFHTNADELLPTKHDDFTVCYVCNHGGHTAHLVEWFESEPQCPVNECTCQCATFSQNLLTAEEIEETLTNSSNMRAKSHLCNPECAITSSSSSENEGIEYGKNMLPVRKHL